MNLCDKFDNKTKKKMRKMIYRSFRKKKECGAKIKKDFSLGKIGWGSTKEVHVPFDWTDVLPNYVENISIGDFHTHPFSNDSIKLIQKKMESVNENENAIIMALSEPSKKDILTAISLAYSIGCIGVSINKKYFVRCFEFDKNAYYQELRKMVNNKIHKSFPFIPGYEDIKVENKRLIKDQCIINLGKKIF